MSKKKKKADKSNDIMGLSNDVMAFMQYRQKKFCRMMKPDKLWSDMQLQFYISLNVIFHILYKNEFACYFQFLSSGHEIEKIEFKED